LTKELEALAEAKATPAYMVLMYLVAMNAGDRVFYKNVIEALTRYFNKQNLSEYGAEKDVDGFLMDLIRKVEEDKTNRLNADYIAGYLTHTIYLK